MKFMSIPPPPPPSLKTAVMSPDCVIVVWNGLVEDYQPLKNELISVKLFKLTLNAYKERVNLERKHRDNLPALSDDKIKELYNRTKSHEWELFSYYPPDENDKDYRHKTVFLLEPKATGKNSFGRDGDVFY